ncbi:MAG: glycosyltransferase family 9 protein [Planctomycetes bacterium]|nr:glycosyltransferase family 9 protein [Planctomycetota bacterium]
MKRIGIRLPNPIGDVVAATPLLRLIRQRNPDSRIAIIGSSKACEVLAGLDTYDEVEVLETRALHGLSSFRHQAHQLKRLVLDQIYLLPNSASSAWAATLAGIPHRIGRRALGRSVFLTERLPRVREAMAMTRIYSEFVGESMPPPLELEVGPRGQRLAQETLAALAENGYHPPFLGVAPGAAFGSSKVYPAKLMSEAVRRAHKATGLQPLYFGAPEEAPLIRRVKADYPAPFMHSSLAEMKALLQECKVLLTMDSGARHLAAALKVPQVVIYGSTNPEWTTFEQELTVTLRREDVDCSPCHRKTCPIDHRCMTRITPGEVADATETAIQKGSILSFE